MALKNAFRLLPLALVLSLSTSCVVEVPVAGEGLEDTDAGNGSGTGLGDGTGGGATNELPVANVSNGSGGPIGLVETSSTQGLTYRINAPQPEAGVARGLLVMLHGSGASNYAEFMTLMDSVATENDLILVSVLAPNGQGWNENGDNAQTQAANLLGDLVQTDLYSQYNIDKSRVLFSGQSSGGGFLGSHFVPLQAKNFQGGALLQCGAAPPTQSVSFAPDIATTEAFRLHFEITTGDTIWPESYDKALTAYSEAGMTLTSNNTKPGGHCRFDQSQVVRDHIASLLP